MMLGSLEKDRAIRTLFLLEGRRIRGDGHMIVLVPGFLEFVKMVDGILKELAAQGELPPNMRPQAFRSALMGAVEGMLRDHMLARTSRFPASHAESDMRAVVNGSFRIHIDPAQDGAEIVNGVADRVRAELLRNMGLADLLKPTGQSVVRATS